jgi:methylated-DNA-[protein]-cysteine S-methyltransferase
MPQNSANSTGRKRRTDWISQSTEVRRLLSVIRNQEEMTMAIMNEAPAAAAAVTHTTINCGLGELTVVARDETLGGLYFPHHWHRPDPAAFGPRSDAGFETVAAQIAEYLAGERRNFEVPIATDGNERQERVWSLIRRIPYGEAVTYGDLAGPVPARPGSRRLGLGAAAVLMRSHVPSGRRVYVT